MNHRVYQNKFALPIVTEELRYCGPKLGTLAFQRYMERHTEEEQE